MADQMAGFIVVLDSNLKSDEATEVLSAISLFKGVLSVKPVKANGELQIAETRVLHNMRNKILDVLNKE